MAWRVQHVAAHLADVKAVALFEERVELRAVALELGALVEDLAEGVLDDPDVVADADLAAELLLKIGRGGEVVGMDMGLQDPLHVEALALDMGDDGVGRSGYPCGPTRSSKSSTLSMIAAAEPSGSRTT